MIPVRNGKGDPSNTGTDSRALAALRAHWSNGTGRGSPNTSDAGGLLAGRFTRSAEGVERRAWSGGRGIRTHGDVAATMVFKTIAIGH